MGIMALQINIDAVGADMSEWLTVRETYFERTVNRMRAIDADALRDRLQNLGYDDWNQGTTTTWAEAFIECADMVDEQPTIEPQRKKGHWIRHPEQRNIFNGKTIECSECHEKYTVRYVEDEWFCRHCGADMREGEV